MVIGMMITSCKYIIDGKKWKNLKAILHLKNKGFFFFFKHIPDFASIPKDFTADVKELYINQDWKHGQEKKKRNHIQRKWHSEEKKKKK